MSAASGLGGDGTLPFEVIEVTPEMVEAGQEAYAVHFIDLRHDETGDVSRKMVTEVYVTMVKCRRISRELAHRMH